MILIILYVLLNVLDLAITKITVKRGGEEGNPLMKNHMVLKKIISVSIVIILLSFASAFLQNITYLILDGLYLGICVYNGVMARRLREGL